MALSARDAQILEYLETTGACTYARLSEVIGVGEMTVRRAVDRLAKQGKVFKVLGGVQTANAPKQFYESELHRRYRQNAVEKRAIALKALDLVEPHQTIYLDGGTTSLAFAKLVSTEKRPLNIVTNSVYVCLELAGANHISILSLGGKLDPGSGCFVGPTSEEVAGRFFVDIAFLSTMGVVPSIGTFESNIATLRIKQMISEQAGRIVLLVDHTKFGSRALCKVLDIQQIHEVVTDSGVPAATVKELEQFGPKVNIATMSNATAGVSASAS
ncbi:MAG: DeoR/GlpR family DNA-binding transcription regulator [Pirellulales bacterium]